MNPKASKLRRDLHGMQHSSHLILDMLSMMNLDQKEKQDDQRMDHTQKKNNRTFFLYKTNTIVDDNIPVPVIRSYAVSTAKDHDTTVDLSKTGITVYRDRGYFGHDPKGILKAKRI